MSAKKPGPKHGYQPKNDKPKAKMGRPTMYTQELADEICRRMSDGTSLRKVCEADDMPDRATVVDWDQKNPDFSRQYRKAREAMYDAWSDQIMTISDDTTRDYVDEEGQRLNGEHVQRSKLRVDSRKWLLSKLVPHRYGESQTLKHVGSIDTSPQSVEELKAKAEALGINAADLFV